MAFELVPVCDICKSKHTLPIDKTIDYEVDGKAEKQTNMICETCLSNSYSELYIRLIEDKKVDINEVNCCLANIIKERVK